MDIFITMPLHTPDASDTKLSKEEFVKEGLSEIVGNRKANDVPTSKKDLKRLRKFLEDDWDLHNN